MDYRIEQLRYLLREDPSSRIFFQLGELLRREGEATQAVKVLESGLERHPRYVAAWVSLGRSQRDLHALAEAEHAFETALEIDRENPVAARLLGETAIEREDWLGAVKALKLTRALTGGDDEIDAQIALVEERLDGDGRLEQPGKVEHRVEPPARFLEIVNLSADDPFSASSEAIESMDVASDVFDLTEVSTEVRPDEVADDGGSPVDLLAAADRLEEEAPGADEDAPEEPVDAEPPVSHGASELEIEAAEEEPLVAEAEVETEVADHPPELTQAVDESSVGAWSTTMKAAGVAGEEAWSEPTDEFVIGEHELSTDGPWIEPAAAVEAVETVSDEPAGLEEETEELPSTDEASVEMASQADGPADDEPQAVEKPSFDPIEVTHPDVVERRAAAMEAEIEAEEPAVPKVEDQPVDHDPEPAEEPVGDELLPGEDRGLESTKLTRPIAISPGMIETEPPSEVVAAEPDAPSAEVVDDTAGGDEVKTTDKRHELEHGVPLPTMTRARLALDQGDRQLAMATLESLIERDPDNAEATFMLGELQAHEAKMEDNKLRAVQATTKIAALQGWLDAVRLAAERRAP